MFGNKPGQRIIELAETDSTNSYAARLLHDEIPEEGTLIYTRFQKAGRGQRGTTWESENGKNLLLSYIFYPTFLPVGDQFVFNQTIAIALRETLQQFTSAAVSIKWPNDLIVNGGKIAGILIENSIRNGKIIHSITGAGININQTQFLNYYPPATSLALLENKIFNPGDILKKLNATTDKWYTQLRLGNHQAIKETYLNHLFLYNQLSKFESNGIRFQGTIRGVNPDGRLSVWKEDETDVLFSYKEVKFLF